MNKLRRSTLYLGMTAALALICVGLLLHASSEVRNDGGKLEIKAALVRRLALTDLCLFTEASYTRHPGMTDPSVPFQEAPMSREHFPSGALVEPPAHLLGDNRD